MANLFIIRELSQNKGITLRDIAAKVGISEDGLQKMIKNGRTNTETLEKIAGVLDVPIGIFWMDNYINQKNTNGDNISGNSIIVNKTEVDKLHDIIRVKDEQINKLLEIILKSNQNDFKTI
jgi:transcriptional regulator with XRE-family HTH domain